MEQKDFERIAKLEVKLESMNETMIRIEKNLVRNHANQMTRNEVEKMFTLRDRDIEDLRDEIENLKEAPEKDAATKRANLSIVISSLMFASSLIFSFLNYMK
ncbi:hypothetical protein BAMA_15810 [Bacillus manliponensis]|uniref:Uncharacterized protein n=1 Tax=Bacillus manliponensis TaxID=574376 RepID=A0A073JSK3_9BACI|nr:hypothetical protein [Bacillus manliponensis]KEK17295.1 hypothetical protein BAMA_15810 [Bacillus manliponensis]